LGVATLKQRKIGPRHVLGFVFAPAYKALAMTDANIALESNPAESINIALPDHPNALLTETQAAYLLGVRHRTLQGWRQRGDGPPFVKVSRRAVRYRRRDLLEFVEARLVSSTS
jgi:predicted DNA-binding transcriptional regulator AlpA